MEAQKRTHGFCRDCRDGGGKSEGGPREEREGRPFSASGRLQDASNDDRGAGCQFRRPAQHTREIDSAYRAQGTRRQQRQSCLRRFGLQASSSQGML